MRIPRIPTPPSVKPVKSGPKAPKPMAPPLTSKKATTLPGSKYFGLKGK